MTDSRPSSLERLIQDHAPFLERLARALVGDPDRAKELVQETWAVALAKPGALDSLQQQGHGPTRGWLATVLRRRSSSGMRRAGIRRMEEISVEQASGDQLPDATAARWERQRIVQEALHGLPEPYRTVVILRFQDDLSPKEIAGRMDITASTVRSQVARGLEQLRDVLDRQHPGGRVEWLSALLPLGWPGFALPAPAAGSSIGIAAAAQPISAAAGAVFMKKSLLAMFAVILAALAYVQPWTAPEAATANGMKEVAVAGDLVGLGAIDDESEPAVTVVAVQENAGPGRKTIFSREPSLAGEVMPVARASSELDSAATDSSGAFILSGRALLLDGTPIPGQRVSAKSDVKGAKDNARSTTDEDGAFEIAMASEGPHTVTLDCHGKIADSKLVDLTAPSEGIEFRVDAIVFRAHLPKDLDLGIFDTGGRHAMVAYGADNLPFGTLSRGGFNPTSLDDISQELLPTGPGYFCFVGSHGEEPTHLIARLAPGAASGVYDIDFVAESPALASLQVTLTGAAVAAPSRVTVGLEWSDHGKPVRWPGSLFFEEGRRFARAGVLLPGVYTINTKVFSPPPNAWLVPKALTQTVALEAGDEKTIEVEVVEGGGLDLVFNGDEGSYPFGLKLETSGPGGHDWSPHATYVPGEDNGFKVGSMHTPGVSYKSWEPLPVGEIRVRISAKGFHSVEEKLFIKAGALTKWNPHMEPLAPTGTSPR